MSHKILNSLGQAHGRFLVEKEFFNVGVKIHEMKD